MSTTQQRNSFMRLAVKLLRDGVKCKAERRPIIPMAMQAQLRRVSRPLTTRGGIRNFGSFSTVGVRLPVLLGLGWGFSSSKEEKVEETPKLSPDAETIKLADALYDEYNIDALYELLIKNKDSKNDELLWRLARASRSKSQLSKDKEESKKFMYEALAYIEAALSINDNNYACHKWKAIILDLVGEIEGHKKRIENAFICKEHFKKAISLNPSDATVVHCLGMWCFTIADMSWVMRKVASTLYATPPESNYDEALQYFLDAEKAQPGFYSMNLLMIGKTYTRLGKKALAIEFLKKANEYPVVTADDAKANKESAELLKSLGVN